MNEVEQATAELAESIAKRDAAIRTMREQGQSLRQLAEWSGLSKDTVATITRGAPYGVQ